MGRKNESWQSLFSEAKQWHEKAIQGDKSATNKAHKLLKKASKEVPDNHPVKAYFGSVTTLLGRDATDTQEKFQHASKGLKMLDEVVRKEPKNIDIRALRGFVCHGLPEMYFHRTDTAINDFQYLISNKRSISKDFFCKILYDLGFAYKKLGRDSEANEAWGKLLYETKDAKYRALLEQEGINVSNLKKRSSYVKKKIDEAHQPFPIEGLQLYHQAMAGDKHSARKAFDFFESHNNNNPTNVLVRAYYADSMSLAGKHSVEVQDMYANAMKAMKIYDKLLNAHPDNMTLRYMRGYHSFRIPEQHFHRSMTAIKDFEYIKEHCKENQFILEPEMYWKLLFDLGLAYKQMEMEEESESVWEELLTENPDSKYKEMIAEQQKPKQQNEMAFYQFNSDETVYGKGKHLHDLGVKGDQEASEVAMEIWKVTHEEVPEDPVAQAYYGSSMALVGWHSPKPKKTFGNAIQGLTLINKAIDRDSDNPEIRLLRAYLTFHLPESFFELTDQAIKDFTFLMEAYEQDHSIFSEELYHQILNDLAEAYKRVDKEAESRIILAKLPSNAAGFSYSVNDIVSTDDQSIEYVNPAAYYKNLR